MKRTIGFWRAWALVVGITIGTGIFMLPAYLAPFGRLSIFGWILSAGGTLTIAILLGILSKKIPKQGGPYVYTREAFGDLPGFIIAWGYWISIWTAVGAGGVAFSGYLEVIIPGIKDSPIAGGLISLIVIWIVTAINITGVKSMGTFQLITTLLKILPLFLVASLGLFLGDFDQVKVESVYEGSTFNTYSTMILITMWAFVGIEGVTIPADNIKNPSKTIPRALIVGTLTIAAIYILTTIGVMALVPRNELLQSTSPIADAAAVIFGPVGGIIIAIGALISVIGSMNGNAFIAGTTPQAVAKDKLFPSIFGRLNKAGAPSFALIISAFLASLMIVFNYSGGMRSLYLLLFKLSTLGTLLPYLGSALAEMYFQYRDKTNNKKVSLYNLAVAIGAFGFVIFAIVGSSYDEILWGGILIAAGLLLYVFMQKTKK